MLYFLVKFTEDGDAVRAKKVTIRSNTSFEVTTDKNETLLLHKSKIDSITPTTSSWKVLEANGVKKAEVV